MSNNNIQILSYSELLDSSNQENCKSSITSQIISAFGYNGLGVVLIKDVPEYAEARRRLLPLASEFARLPSDVKEKYVDEVSIVKISVQFEFK